MEFRSNKCAVITIKREVKIRCEGIKIPNENVIKDVDIECYKYLGVRRSRD